ncbi:MAG: HAD-IB family phosphatase [Bacilli bacterium]
MNIYDFDNTIYNGDTNKDILLYSFKKHPFKVIKALNKTKKLERDYKRGLITFERVKEAMLSFLFEIEDLNGYIEKFVDSHMKNIKPWYLSRKTEYDIVISASYELWIIPFCKKLGIKYVLATKTDKDGHIIGKNCKGEEKVKRLASTIPNAQIVTSYSDSESDLPILNIAKTAYVVEGNKLIPYVKGYKFKNKN